MAYEEKRNVDNDNSFISLLKLVRILVQKWWVIVLFIVLFSAGGFGFAKLTYTESYYSGMIFTISNKDKDIAGSAATYFTASDAQASSAIATNFKELILRSNDFITSVQDVVYAKTGEKFSKTELRSMISTELITDSTLLYVTVRANNPDVAYAVATAIQSTYPDIAKVASATGYIEISDSATQPQLAADSSTLIYTAAGFLIGAALSVLILLISSKIKNVVLSSEDIKRNFNINIIATVSKIKRKKNDKIKLLITDRNVGLPFIETFKLIRTKLENVKLKKGYSVFAVTSSTESEGKTTCSANIALSLAKSGKSVILIDADLRKPAVCKTLGIEIEGEKGLFDIVSGRKTFEQAVKYVEKYNLYLLVSSTSITDPSEVLASKNMDAIIKEAKKNFDYIIVDCPPAGVVADAAIIANYTDTIIFVTAEDKVSLSQVEYALSDLMTTKSEILGCIYNCANSKILSIGSDKNGGYFSAGYGGYYGSSTAYGYSQHSKRR